MSQPDPRWDRLKDLFAAAAAVPPGEREAFLRERGVGDATVQEVLDLLGSSAPLDEQPGDTIGPYKLLECIGEGGYGSVWMAEQRAPIQRLVALKLLKAGMDSTQVLARFEQERQALALMQHPNIAQVYDAGTTKRGRPFFVMELVKGVPITDYATRERLGLRQRLEVFEQVCRAVQHAHQKGVIHRDIKPSNVLVVTADGRPLAKVIDFGIAKATAGRLTERTLFTEHRAMVGTLAYMSPEQAEGLLDVDTRADVYSLGALLYELLTGGTPFDAGKLVAAGFGEMLRVLREVEPEKPSVRVSSKAGAGWVAGGALGERDPKRLFGSLRGDLDWVVMKALEKDRARRYGTAEGLAADVESYLRGEAVTAVPPSVGYRLRTFVRRNRGLVFGATAFVITLITGILSTTWALEKAWKEREKMRSLGIAAVHSMQRVSEDREVNLHVTARDGRIVADDEQDHARVEVVLESLTEQVIARVRSTEIEAYVAHIQAADAALANHDVRTVRQNLDACPKHLRHWEWDYLDAASERSEFILAGHEGPVRFVAYDQKGERLVTASDDGTARLWDPRTGKACGVLHHGGAAVRKAQLHPDGRWVATATASGEVAVWDFASSARVATLVVAGSERVDSDFAWSPDGLQVATVVCQGPTTLWACGTWQRGRVLEGESRHVHDVHVEFAPEAARLVTWSPHYAPVLWDLEAGKRLATLDGLAQEVRMVKIDKWSCQAVGLDGRALSWDLANGFRRQQGDAVGNLWREGEVQWTQLSDWGATMVNGSPDGEVQVLHAMFGGGYTDTLLGHTGQVVFARVVHETGQIVTASRDGTSRLWNGPQEVALFLGHTAPIIHAALRTDEHQFATVAEDHTCRLWNLQHTWEQRRTLSNLGGLCDIDFSPDGKRLLFRSLGKCTIQDLGTSQATGSVDTGAMIYYAAWCGNGVVASGPSLCFHDPHGRSLLTTGHEHESDNLIEEAIGSPSHLLLRSPSRCDLFHVATGNRVELGELRCADLDPTSPRLVIARKDRTVEVSSLADDTILCRIPAQPSDVTTLRFRPDAQQFLIATTETLKVFATDSGARVATMPMGMHQDPIWSRSGTHIASWSPDGIQVFDARNGERLCRVKPASIGALDDFLFGRKRKFELSPDGARLLVCWSEDRATPLLYETTTGRELLRLRGRSAADGLQGAFSPDGRTIAVCCFGDDVTVWDSRTMAERLATARQFLMQRGRSLDADEAMAKRRARAGRLAKARNSEDELEAICTNKATAEQLAECLALLRDALADSSGDSTIQLHCAIVSYHAGAHADCERLLTELGNAQGRDEDDANTPLELSFLSMAQSRLGQRDAALANLTLLDDYDPDNLYYAAFGLTCYELQRQARAVFLECFPDAKLPEARK